MTIQKCIEQYFSSTPASNWDILTLAMKTAQVESRCSKAAFVGKLRSHLESIQKSQLMKKTVKDKAKQLSDLLSKDVLKTLEDIFDNADIISGSPSKNPLQHMVTIQANDINDSTIVGNMNMTVVDKSATSSLKRRVTEEQMDGDDDDIFLPQPKRHNPLQEFSEEHPEDDIVIHEKDHAMLLAEGKSYRLYRPGHAINSPHRPKVESINMKSLSEYVVIAGSRINCSVPEVKSELEANVRGASMNESLKAIPGAFEFLRNALELPYEDFPKKLWQLDYGTDVQESKDIINIMQYTLTSFHLHCRQHIEPTEHERTYFVQSVIPPFQALGQVTGLLKYNWCEKQLLASKLVYVKMDADDKRSTSRMMDGLGRAHTAHGSMEALLLEASGGNREEHTMHSLNDTVKLLECATNSLLVEMHHYKCASYDTYKKLKVFTVQCIKDELAMYEVSLLDSSKWKSIEKRTCKVPNSWDQRALWTKFFELIATLMISLKQAKRTLDSLSMEAAGLKEVEGQTVNEALYHAS